MNKYPPILNDLDDWARAAGHERQFIATDLEVQEWLTSALPTQYAPYYIHGSDLEKRPGWDRYKHVPFTCHISQFLICMQGRSGQPRMKFYIRSSKLTPVLKLEIGDRVNAICTYNGLIDLIHGGMHSKIVSPNAITRSERRSKELFRDTSSIAVTYKMRNIVNGEERRYDGYLEIFEALRKTIKKALRYSSIISSLIGEGEDTRTNLWTEGAYLAYQNGFPFFHRPGNLIEKKRPKKK